MAMLRLSDGGGTVCGSFLSCRNSSSGGSSLTALDVKRIIDSEHIKHKAEFEKMIKEALK